MTINLRLSRAIIFMALIGILCAIPAHAITQSSQCLPGYTLNSSTNKCEAAAPVIACSLNQEMYTSQAACNSGCVQTAQCTTRNTQNTQVTAGLNHACGLQKDKTVWCWGHNNYGQLGNGTTTDSDVPVQVSGLTDVASIHASHQHTCAIKSDGTVWCWGLNNYGQLGDGTTTDSNVPVQAHCLTGSVKINASHNSTYALKANGTIVVTGGYDHAPGVAYPILNEDANADLYMVDEGTHCKIGEGGTVWCWGLNNYGQLGNDTTTRYSDVPVKVSGLTGVVAVGGGYQHVCALKSDGTVWCWGLNEYGQLGSKSSFDYIARYPKQVVIYNGEPLTGVTQISVDNWSVTAVRQSDGTLWHWGYELTGGIKWAYAHKINTNVISTYNRMTPYIIKSDGMIWGQNPYNSDHQELIYVSFNPADSPCPLPGGSSCSGNPSSCSLSGTCSYVPGNFTCPAEGTLNTTNYTCESPKITITASIDGAESLRIGETGQYTLTGSSSMGEVEYQLTLPDGSQVNGNTFTYNPKNTVGNQTITGKVFLRDYPTIYATVTKTINVSYPPIPTVTLTGPSTLIEGDKAQYSVTHDSNLPVTIEWKVDGVDRSGNLIEVSFNNIGTHKIEVKVYLTDCPEIGKALSKNIMVTAYPTPIISITGPKMPKAGDMAQYSITHDSKLPVTVEWEVDGVKYEGTSLEIPFLKAGIYNITATAYPTAYPNSKRTASLKALVSAYPVPTISLFGPRTVKQLAPAEYSITHDATVPVTVEWEVDGVKYEGTPINITFPTPGTKKLSFAVYPTAYPDSKKTGSIDISVTKDAELNYVMPAFTIKALHMPTGTAPYKVGYKVNGNTSNLPATFSYAWDMGDGTTYTDLTLVNHVYSVAGNYNVSLVITDSKGNTQTLTDTVTVEQPPPLLVESITATPSNKQWKAPVKVRFAPKISGGNMKTDKIASYQWYVNEAPLDVTTKNAFITFNDPGTYYVSLVVSTKHGYTGANATTITAVENQPPECSINYTDKPNQKTTAFEAVCTDPDGRMKRYSWDFGNGQTSKTKKPYIRYDSGGTYTVTLTAADDSNAEVVATQVVTVER